MPSILPKNELETSNFCPGLLGQKFFVRFLEELKKKNVLSKLPNLYLLKDGHFVTYNFPPTGVYIFFVYSMSEVSFKNRYIHKVWFRLNRTKNLQMDTLVLVLFFFGAFLEINGLTLPRWNYS